MAEITMCRRKRERNKTQLRKENNGKCVCYYYLCARSWWPCLPQLLSFLFFCHPPPTPAPRLFSFEADFIFLSLISHPFFGRSDLLLRAFFGDLLFLSATGHLSTLLLAALFDLDRRETVNFEENFCFFIIVFKKNVFSLSRTHTLSLSRSFSRYRASVSDDPDV